MKPADIINTQEWHTSDRQRLVGEYLLYASLVGDSYVAGVIEPGERGDVLPLGRHATLAEAEAAVDAWAEIHVGPTDVDDAPEVPLHIGEWPALAVIR